MRQEVDNRFPRRRRIDDRIHSRWRRITDVTCPDGAELHRERALFAISCKYVDRRAGIEISRELQHQMSGRAESRKAKSLAVRNICAPKRSPSYRTRAE